MSEQKKQELTERQIQKRETIQQVQKLFNGPNGKDVLKKISEMCNENEPTYVDQNPNGTAYREGQRSIIIGIRKMLNKTFEVRQKNTGERK